MAEDIASTTGIASHSANRLPSVEIDSFNVELKDEEGFIGDRASKGAFRKTQRDRGIRAGARLCHAALPRPSASWSAAASATPD